jgi:acyl-CoA reductase-like NAD-dependent aldehyde dehydrogenase
VNTNDAVISDEHHLAFSEAKESGFGRAVGMASIVELTEVTWVTFQPGKRAFRF